MDAQITFRADASVAIGTGHIMRCLTLADALTAQGATVRFACSSATPTVVPRLRQSAYPIDIQPQSGDLLVVDHYGLDRDYERQARPHYRRIMVIDDLPHRAHDCDLLLDQTYGRMAPDWQPLLPAHARILAGTSYLLLRPEFVRTVPPRETLRSILVTLGGTDPDNVTSMVLDGIARSGFSGEIHVVMGEQSPHLAAVSDQIDRLPQAHLHVNAAHMAELMAQADLAIGAGGTTAWERCRLGLPTILLQIADNQRDVITALSTAGAAITCALTADAIAAAVGRIMNTPDLLPQLSANASRICPHDSTERVVQAIFNLLRDAP